MYMLMHCLQKVSIIVLFFFSMIVFRHRFYMTSLLSLETTSWQWKKARQSLSPIRYRHTNAPLLVVFQIGLLFNFFYCTLAFYSACLDGIVMSDVDVGVFLCLSWQMCILVDVISIMWQLRINQGVSYQWHWYRSENCKCSCFGEFS